MIHVLCGRDSVSARDLALALTEAGAPAVRGRNANKVREGDLVINWGESIAPGLNAKAGCNKRTEMQLLAKAKVPTLVHSLTKPADPDGWLARAASHHEGIDLLEPKGVVPALWTRWENFDFEFRVHIFRRGVGDGAEYVSVRLGSKFPRPDVAKPLAWIRSHRGGWHILYNAEAQERAKKVKGLRQAAAAAIKARGLDFGAVDIGVKKRDGLPLVLEVNSAPGIEGRSLEVYVREFIRLSKEKGGV
jgi:hypothetical protein